MPIYEFQCKACGHIFEELCATNASMDCPSCGAPNAERRISAPAPLKKGAFPFKPGPVHPLASSPNRPQACGACGTGACSRN